MQERPQKLMALGLGSTPMSVDPKMVVTTAEREDVERAMRKRHLVLPDGPEGEKVMQLIVQAWRERLAR